MSLVAGQHPQSFNVGPINYSDRFATIRGQVGFGHSRNLGGDLDVFISWSGERSRVFAEALRNWIPKIMNAVEPWLSSSDIEKGARWGVDVATKLEASKVGIICLTPG